jgi:thermitase
LAANPAVFAAEPNFVGSIFGVTPNDPGFVICQPGDFNCQTHSAAPQLILIGADKAWTITTGLGPNLQAPPPLIAIVDTGVDYTHEDLSFPGKVVLGPNVVGQNNDPLDDNGHGTFIAGIAGAETNNGIGIPGVSWASSLLAVKVSNSLGFPQDFDVQSGVSYAVRNGAKIINLSLGHTGTSTAFASALNDANMAGRLVVAGVGNNGCDIPFYPAAYGPTTTADNGAVYDTTVLSVGGVNLDGTLAISGSPCASGTIGSNYGSWVDIYAPFSTYSTTAHHVSQSEVNLQHPGGYDFASGTSFSTPFVSGAAALVWAANPQLSAKDVRSALLEGAANLIGGAKDPDGNPINILNVFDALFQGATNCTACPQPPEVNVVSRLYSPIISVGVPRGASDTQNISVHGVSIPLAPLSSSNAASAIFPIYYKVTFEHFFASWDVYDCCGPRLTGTGWFDPFSVSTSTAPYWQMGVQNPIWSQLPFVKSQVACPLGNATQQPCPFFAPYLEGGGGPVGTLYSLGSLTSTIQSPGSPILNENTQTGQLAGQLGVTWLNLILDTASPPNADNLFPSWGFFAIQDITPICTANQC